MREADREAVGELLAEIAEQFQKMARSIEYLRVYIEAEDEEEDE